MTARRVAFPSDMDPECVGLCEALNTLPGVTTLESCSGHGEEPYRIWLKVERLRNLPLVAYWLQPCHSDVMRKWFMYVNPHCTVRTLYGDDPAVDFVVEGPAGAFDDAEQIAEAIWIGFPRDRVALVCPVCWRQCGPSCDRAGDACLDVQCAGRLVPLDARTRALWRAHWGVEGVTSRVGREA
jgi:hypothetical protein